MALPATETILSLLKNTLKKPQLIVEVDGWPVISSIPNQVYAYYGQPGLTYGMPGLVYGGLAIDETSYPYIDLNKSTNNITQQLLIDKGGYSSSTNFDISIVDKDKFITQLITPGLITDDTLGKKARIYLSLEGAGHPEDSILFFSGIVSDIKASAGYININISSPEKMKTSEIFPKVSTELTQEMNGQSVVIQGNRYSSVNNSENVTLTYNVLSWIGTTEVEVTTSGPSITVNLRPNPSNPNITASQVKTAINNSAEARTLVSCKTLQDQSSYPQTSQPTTALTTDDSCVVQDPIGFLLQADNQTLETYLKIDDEIIKYTSISGDVFTGLERGQFGTIVANHTVGANVESYYRLKGNLRDLALKLMLSGGEEYYVTDLSILSFNQYGLTTVPNAIFLSEYYPDQKYGTVIGDSVLISDAINAGNNGAAQVLSIVTNDLGSYFILDKTLITEGSGAKVALKSKYNVLPKFAGLEMTPDQVDVAEFERIYTQFSSQFFEYDFYIKDQINGSEFINTQILYPSGCYALPRKAKTSIGLTVPPLAVYGTKKLTNLNVVKASGIRINRSISKNFYNAVVYKYDPDAVEDKFLRGKVTQSADSTNRIKVSNKALTIEAEGVRFSSNFENIFNTQTTRFLQRYQYGAESFDVQVLFGEGFTIEIGDTVILDGRELQMSDTKDANGTRNFLPRLFEVQNKSMSLKGTEITLTLVDTVYSLNGRYGVVAPSSYFDTGSTTTKLKLKKSYSDLLTNRFASAKWSNYIGEKILIRSDDWTFQEIVTIQGIDPNNPDGLIVTPALSIAPTENMIADTPVYPSNFDQEDQAIYKATHCSLNKTYTIMSGSTDTQLVFSSIDAPLFQKGFVLRVHSDDYTVYSKEVKIIDVFLSSVSPSYVTLSESLGFTPSLQHRIELLGFPDGSSPYRFV